MNYPGRDWSRHIPKLHPPASLGDPNRMPMPIMEFKGFNDSERYDQWREWCTQQRITKSLGKRKTPKRDSGA